MAYHVYVSNSGSDFLSHFIMDESTGKLDPQANIEPGGQPGALATNAEQTLLYACLRANAEIASFRIDSASGALERIGSQTIRESSPYIGTDHKDGYLVAAYYGGAGATVHRIEADGTVSAEQQWVATAPRAHSFAIDRSNRFLFVPHTVPGNAIYQFRFDESSGQLSANDPAFVQPDTPEGPRHLVFHPHQDVLYSVNEDGCTVSAYRFDPDAGTLESFQLISTVPEGIDMEGKSTAEIKITADGRNLYASNRGHDTLAHFRIGDDGSLTAGTRFPTEPVPRFFELAPAGGFVYSAGQDSNRLVSYRLDDASGDLEPFEYYDVGETPLWIQFAKQA